MSEPADPRIEHDRRASKQRAPRRRPGRDHDRDRERHQKDGDDPRAHALILERRWFGSARPTAELYARALQQWHRLPGAVLSSSTPVPVPPSAAEPTGHQDIGENAGGEES